MLYGENPRRALYGSEGTTRERVLQEGFAASNIIGTPGFRGHDPREGTARLIGGDDSNICREVQRARPERGYCKARCFTWRAACLAVALGSTRERVLQVRVWPNMAMPTTVALGSTRVRVLQERLGYRITTCHRQVALGSTRVRVLQG